MIQNYFMLLGAFKVKTFFTFYLVLFNYLLGWFVKSVKNNNFALRFWIFSDFQESNEMSKLLEQTRIMTLI